MRVLLVDDEPNTRDVYGRLLELAGHEVVTAESAESAALAIEGGSFDAAVIDLVLGGADGLTVLEHVKRRHPGVRAVVVSAYEVPGAMDRARALHAEGFLAKPVRWTDLRRFLEGDPRGPEQRP
jgi:two-component system, cell cycle response regulator